MSGAGAPMVGAGLCCAACGLGLALGFPLPSPGSRTHPALGGGLWSASFPGLFPLQTFLDPCPGSFQSPGHAEDRWVLLVQSETPEGTVAVHRRWLATAAPTPQFCLAPQRAHWCGLAPGLPASPESILAVVLGLQSHYPPGTWPPTGPPTWRGPGAPASRTAPAEGTRGGGQVLPQPHNPAPLLPGAVAPVPSSSSCWAGSAF